MIEASCGSLVQPKVWVRTSLAAARNRGGFCQMWQMRASRRCHVSSEALQSSSLCNAAPRPITGVRAAVRSVDPHCSTRRIWRRCGVQLIEPGARTRRPSRSHSCACQSASKSPRRCIACAGAVMTRTGPIRNWPNLEVCRCSARGTDVVVSRSRFPSPLVEGQRLVVNRNTSRFPPAGGTTRKGWHNCQARTCIPRYISNVMNRASAADPIAPSTNSLPRALGYEP